MSRYVVPELKKKENIVIPEQGKVLVDFYAEWCGPCKMLSPVLERVTPALESNGITVLKVDVDQHTDLAAKYGIRGVPTLLMIDNNKEVGRKSGVLNDVQLLEFTGATK